MSRVTSTTSVESAPPEQLRLVREEAAAWQEYFELVHGGAGRVRRRQAFRRALAALNALARFERRGSSGGAD